MTSRVRLKQLAQWGGLALTLCLFLFYAGYPDGTYWITPGLGPVLAPFHFVVGLLTLAVWANESRGWLRRRLKTIGFVSSVIMLVFQVVSICGYFCYRSPSAVFSFGQGSVQFTKCLGQSKDAQVLMKPYRFFPMGWSAFRARSWQEVARWTLDGVGTGGSWRVDTTHRPKFCAFQLACCLPLTLIGVPTLLMFWIDRRISPDHCQSCNYNLTGNKSGICPECGTPIPDKQKQTRAANVPASKPNPSAIASTDSPSSSKA